MKIRGHLTVTGGIGLENTKEVLDSSEDIKYVVAISGKNQEKELVFGDLLIQNVASKTYAKAGALVGYSGNLYLSLVDNAEGIDINDDTVWKKIDLDGMSLPDNVVAALLNANEPSGDNVFATLEDIHNLTIEGTAPADEILSKPSNIKNIIWISSTVGEDSFGNDVSVGDGLISTGDGWKNIGPIGATAQQNTFIFSQTTPSTLWRIEHNQGRFPSIMTVDQAKFEISGVSRYISKDIVEIYFSEPVAGSAYLN
jgi:hypothetical protein